MLFKVIVSELGNKKGAVLLLHRPRRRRNTVFAVFPYVTPAGVSVRAY